MQVANDVNEKETNVKKELPNKNCCCEDGVVGNIPFYEKCSEELEHIYFASDTDNISDDNAELFTERCIHFKIDSYLPKKLLYLIQRKTFKNDEKWFLFHLKSYFSSQDI